MVSLLIDALERSCEADPPATITVGRKSVREDGAPQYAAINLSGPNAGPIVEAGQPVTIADGLGPRHRGRITDTALTHDDDGPVQQLTSVGALAAWGRQRIGDTPWPQESVAQRAQRIADLVGLPLIVEGGQELQVIPRDVDSKRGIEVLAELAKTTGGWLYDDGAGIVHLQALDARDVSTTTVLWEQEPAGATWAELDDTTWAEEDQPGPYAPIVLDCTQVDWEPQWTQSLEFVNIVTVTWGPKDPDGNQESVTVSDQASIGDLGESPVTIKSQLADPGDATELAGLILRRSARPRWHLDAVSIDAAGLDPTTLALLGNALPGTRCTITGLPQPAPGNLTAFPGVIEGWTETLYSDADRRLTLWLSHVEESLAVPTWDAEPPGQTWAQLDPAQTWEDDL